MGNSLSAITAILALYIPGTAPFAAEQPAATAATAVSAPSRETREAMAAVHEQMAACLRSDKPVEQCHSEMHKACREKVGQEQCPMMMRIHDRKMQPHGGPPK
jgi:hypothetical protein